MKYRESHLESEKAEKLKVKFTLLNHNVYQVTKNLMVKYLVKFREIYKSYCELQPFLSDLGLKDFDERFDFEIFVIIEEEMTDSL